ERPAFWAWAQDAAYSLRIFNLARSWLPRPVTNQGLNRNPQLSREVKTRLDDRGGYASYHRDDAWHERVRAQFEESIRAMIKMCHDAKIPIILVKLGSNLRDCPPFKSEHNPGLSLADETAWQRRFEAATAAEKTEIDQALAPY